MEPELLDFSISVVKITFTYNLLPPKTWNNSMFMHHVRLYVYVSSSCNFDGIDWMCIVFRRQNSIFICVGPIWPVLYKSEFCHISDTWLMVKTDWRPLFRQASFIWYKRNCRTVNYVSWCVVYLTFQRLPGALYGPLILHIAPSYVRVCICGRLQLECDGTRWRTGGEVKGKLANGLGSQYS
jgi:hypothetical protein